MHEPQASFSTNLQLVLPSFNSSDKSAPLNDNIKTLCNQEKKSKN